MCVGCGLGPGGKTAKGRLEARQPTNIFSGKKNLQSHLLVIFYGRSRLRGPNSGLDSSIDALPSSRSILRLWLGKGESCGVSARPVSTRVSCRGSQASLGQSVRGKNALLCAQKSALITLKFVFVDFSNQSRVESPLMD